jgi:tetratricopeptide (TPR) repeat protein
MEADDIAENFFKPLQRAQLLMDVGRYREAINELNVHLAHFPDSYMGLCNIAVCYLNLKDYQSAYDQTKKAIASEPEGEWAYRLQSIVFIANGEPKRALDAAKLCIEKEPALASSVSCLFWAQAECGLLDDAEVSLASLLDLSPGTADGYEAAGYLALKRERYLEAESHYLEALKIEPESVNALNNLGVAYLELAKEGKGKHYQKKSIEMFERAVKMQPTFKLGQENISHAHDALKVGVPVGLVFLLYVGLQMAGRLSSMLRSDATKAPAELLFTKSYLITINNYYMVLLTASLLITVLFCLRRKYREIILYHLLTVRPWTALTVMFSISTVLYIFSFWVVGEDGNNLSGLGFGLSIALLIVSAVNLARVWSADKKRGPV